MSEVAETVVAQEPEVVEPTEEKPVETADAGSDDVAVVEEKVEEQNGEKVDEAAPETAETVETNGAEADAAEEENKAENGEAKDTNGNDRKRVSSAHDEAAVAEAEAEDDAPSAKKSKVDEEVDVVASGDAPAVSAE